MVRWRLPVRGITGPQCRRLADCPLIRPVRPSSGTPRLGGRPPGRAVAVSARRARRQGPAPVWSAARRFPDANRGGTRRLAAILLLSLLPPFLAAGQAIAKPDFEQAREAVERGRILPLAEVLARLHETQPGRVIEVDLDDEDGMMIYEAELATPDGRLIEVEIDAASGRILALDEEDGD